MKILLLQLKRIGDLILTLPAIAAVREKFPNAEITLIVANECAGLLPAIANVDVGFVTRRSFRDVPLFAAIAARKFDCCIDFTQNDRSAILTFLSGAKKRIGASRVQVRAQRRSRVYNEFVQLRLKQMHTIDYNLALLAPLGTANASPPLRLEPPESARTQARQLLSAGKIYPRSLGSSAAGTDFIVVHPGSARAEKFWEPERWAEVIEHAQMKVRMPVVITGGKWRFEQEHIGRIRAACDARTRASQHETGIIVDLSGKTDLLTLAAIIEQAQLLVTVDSAAMHLAAALRRPQVILFGPTNPYHWRPRESPAVILQGNSGVGLTNFVPKQPRCATNEVSTQAVIDAMDALLSPAAAPSS